jgi:hypothetical protein
MTLSAIAWPLAVAELTHTTTPQAPSPIQRSPAILLSSRKTNSICRQVVSVRFAIC